MIELNDEVELVTIDAQAYQVECPICSENLTVCKYTPRLEKAKVIGVAQPLYQLERLSDGKHCKAAPHRVVKTSDGHDAWMVASSVNRQAIQGQLVQLITQHREHEPLTRQQAKNIVDSIL
jgi:hypothetical protein